MWKYVFILEHGAVVNRYLITERHETATTVSSGGVYIGKYTLSHRGGDISQHHLGRKYEKWRRKRGKI